MKLSLSVNEMIDLSWGPRVVTCGHLCVLALGRGLVGGPAPEVSSRAWLCGRTGWEPFQGAPHPQCGLCFAQKSPLANRPVHTQQASQPFRRKRCSSCCLQSRDPGDGGTATGEKGKQLFLL